MLCLSWMKSSLRSQTPTAEKSMKSLANLTKKAMKRTEPKIYRKAIPLINDTAGVLNGSL